MPLTRAATLVLPVADPGDADLRSPGHYIARIAAQQWRTLTWGALLGIAWMTSLALVPAAVGRAIDDGLAGGQVDPAALAGWAAAVAGLVGVQALTGVLRHRAAVVNWLHAMYRSTQHVSRHLSLAGTAVTARIPTGEVVSTVASDADRLGSAMDVIPRFAGALVAGAVVAALVLSISPTLGVVVLVGVPVMVAALVAVVRPLQARQKEQRELSGRLTTLGADTVAGLRVLRGVGGEEVFAARYRRQSQQVRHAGVRVSSVQAVLDALQVLLPGLLTAVVVWVGARLAAAGEITAGELVAFYGLSAFLVMPLRTAVEAVEKFSRAWVGARKIIALLVVAPSVIDARAFDPGTRDAEIGGDLADPDSGVVLRAGELTALVSADPEDSAVIAARLARADDDTRARIGGVPLTRLPVADVRRRVVLSETDPRLFTGRLVDQLDPSGRRSRADVMAALNDADAGDALDALARGLDGRVDERGRSFSGGQRQRLALARALLTDAEVLVLVEPTSAVDAHTEARIADRIRRRRAGRTTAIATASPLLLDRSDRVLLLADGAVVAQGTHAGLLATHAAYRDVVTRGEDT